MAHLADPAAPELDPKRLAARLARIEERLSALEDAVVQDKDVLAEQGESLAGRRADIEKLEWAVAHGRKRPW